MKNRIYYTVLLLVVILSGCYRDDLCYDHDDNALIELNIDWSRSNLHPNAATALIYKDNTLFRTEIFSVYPPVRKVIELPVGTYNILVFDELESDYQNYLQFNNKNSWSDFELRTIDDYNANRLSRAPLNGPFKSEVDTMAVDRVLNFVITQEMTNRSHLHPTPINKVENREIVTTIGFKPKRVFTIATIVLSVKNGKNYYFTQRNPPYITGTSESYSPGIDKYSLNGISHPIKFQQVPTRANGEDPSSSIATFISTLHLIGLTDYNDPDIPIGAIDYLITLPFTYSGGIIQKTIDLNKDSPEVKKLLHNPEDPNDPNNNWDDLLIEIEIELPPLVEVGGMEAEVEDWVDVDVPLNGPTYVHFLANNGTSDSFKWSNIPGVIINLPQPLFSPQPGYEFKEWNTDPDGYGASFIPGDQFEMRRGGTFFYAMWNKVDLPPVTLTFYANNGSAETITSQQKPGVIVTIPQSLFTAPAGKSFKHWNTAADGSGTFFLPGAKYTMPTSNQNFYTIWQ